MRKYFSYTLDNIIRIDKIKALEYFEARSDFNLDKEKHSFWELSYVDSGTIYANYENECSELNQGDLLIIPPAVMHSYKGKSDVASTVFFICFSCNSKIINSLYGKYTLSDTNKLLLTDLISEVRSTFSFEFKSRIKSLRRQPIGGQQMIDILLTRILIQMLRETKDTEPERHEVITSAFYNGKLTNKIVSLLKDNLYGNMNLEDISKSLFFSKNYLGNIFRQEVGMSIMQYYTALKIDEAKRLIRQNTELKKISELLCFDNQNYFSKVFKKHTGLTPSKYRQKILKL